MQNKIRIALAAAAILILLVIVLHRQKPFAVRQATRMDTSSALANLSPSAAEREASDCEQKETGCGVSPEESEEEHEAEEAQSAAGTPPAAITESGATVEQTAQGPRAPAKLIENFDGLGFGFPNPEGEAVRKNPSDNSLAVGPNHIVQIVNSRLAVFSKKGAVLYGPVVTNTIFSGFGGQCEKRVSGDAVVRYDQLADRWLYVLPIFQRPPDDPKGPYSMCYAVSAGPDPLGPYHRYEFKRDLFPDYPRPAIWPDGYYIPTSTGDTVIQKHACVADRNTMLQGLPATEQCVIIDGVNFLNNADLDGKTLPPPGAPNIMMATGGTQLHKHFEDDAIYAYKFHVDWVTPANTNVSPAIKINVAPYDYLCDGQLTSCVRQPGTPMRLDAQGDKLMQRLVYRNLGDHESIAGLHSINTKAGGGGVRWYEFRLDPQRNPYLYQQSTYAPDGFYRWMGSIGMDRQGNIGMGYSFGGTPNFAGQRFAARLANDPPGKLTYHETVLAEGAAAQTNTLRWEDYATTTMDPSDDCTFWYVGDYLKAGAPSYTSRIGAFRLPGCLQGKVRGTVYFDLNHNGRKDAGEPGLPGRKISYAGGQSGGVTTREDGSFSVTLPADAAYSNTDYVFSQSGPKNVHLNGGDDVSGLDFANFCTVRNSGARDLRFWSSHSGEAKLKGHEAEWRELLNSKVYLENPDGTRFSVPADNGQAWMQFRNWLRAGNNSKQLAVTALNVHFGSQDGNATVQDPVAGDWPTVDSLLERDSQWVSAHPTGSSEGAKYEKLLEKLNQNTAVITPSKPDACKP
jgi:hypothetical protein